MRPLPRSGKQAPFEAAHLGYHATDVEGEMIEAPPNGTPLRPFSADDSTGRRLAGSARPDAGEIRVRASTDRARARWHQLWLRLQSITPSGVARSLLVLGAASIVI